VPGLLATVDAVLTPAFEEFLPGAVSALRVSQRADLQVDGALALARSLGRPPREVAGEVLARALARGLDRICESAEVAGPGFINLTLSADFLVSELTKMAAEPRALGVTKSSRPLKVIVDYASPNAAKQMHVGHLRSTIIGDSLARLLDFVGHEVVRENHIGDWGLPFGFLIEHLLDLGEEAAVRERAMGALEQFYQQARVAYDSDPKFAERARARVVLLQSGDQETLRLWGLLLNQSVSYFDEQLRRLGTQLTRDDVVGESHYNSMLTDVLTGLAQKGLLVESDGAQCVFPPGHTNRSGEPLPLIIQNSVGGFTYAATDLAAIRDRVDRLGARLLVYVVGNPQAEHFAMVFATARLAGWLPESTQAVHVGFGNVLGTDGKMFRTRQGGTVKLDELLDEAVDRATAVMAVRDEEMEKLPPEDFAAVAEAVGVGAVKYADLSADRTRDYRFDWDRMLSFDGNTGPYLQYAHARICSIFRRAEQTGLSPHRPGAVMAIKEHEERALALRLLGFGDTVWSSVGTYSPHKLCGHLFELASAFTAFYEQCPVLRAEDPETRSSRLALCGLTAAVLEMGLGLLGIKVPERM
jgi:arginyl-tRNA synthetase